LGGDYDAYRGHVYRVFNLAYSVLGNEPDGEEQLAIACVFHDLGIWTARTFDYLGPSEALASEYLHLHDLRDWIRPVTLAIDHHHKLRPYSGPHETLVEALRRADLADLSFGLISGGLDRILARKTRDAFPNAGFHRRLMGLSFGWALRHPLRPLPMLKW
jgi:hypothetical protein